MDVELGLASLGLAVSAPLYVVGACLWMRVDTKIRQRGRLLMAAGAGVQVLVCTLTNDDVLASLNTATLAWHLYEWWNNGGGDGTKRRLKKVAGYLGFGPQAAPQGA
jgi:hypothetical protein